MHIYRGVKIYEKPGRRKSDPNNSRIAGEIYGLGMQRVWVPQEDTIEKMLVNARRIIDARLGDTDDVAIRWFSQPLV